MKKYQYLPIVLVCLWGLIITPAMLWASMPEGADVLPPQAGVKAAEPLSADSFEAEDGETESPGEDSAAGGEEETNLDRSKKYVDSQVQRASQWVDGFFDDPYNVAEATSTQFRLRPEVYYREEQDTKFKLKASVKIHLPGLSDKVSFVAGSDENGDESSDANSDIEDESIVGFQFFLSNSAKWNASITTGVKFDSFAGFIGPRVRYQTSMSDNSSLRLIQTVRWQTNNYWDIGSRADLNFVISDRFYFRETVFGRWRGDESDEKGYRTRVSSVLSQKLSSSAGLQYDFSTIFHTEPDNHVDEYTLALRFRKRTRREWLYYEIVPQVSFEDEFDYKANPGIRLRLELFFGGSTTGEFWKRTQEDDEEFRW